MKSVSISGSPRVNVGKKDAKALRRQGQVPCVLYGGKEQIHFSTPERDFVKLVYSPDIHLVKLDVGGHNYDAIMQEIQFHKLSDKINHIDFREVIPGKPVVVNLPVKVEGNAVGVRAGGKLHKKMRTLAGILVLIWVAGLIFHLLGKFINIALGIAVILIIWHFVKANKKTT